MADSNITKKALANALKELMEEMPFAKISISDICGKCNMNRKSFYYHFKDKYDLVNWIYDTEFIAVARKKDYNVSDGLILDIFKFLYENRVFYRKALSIEGQNSFSDHFHDMISTIIGNHLKEIVPHNSSYTFQLDFFTDAFVLATHKWIKDPYPMEPEAFMHELQCCTHYLAKIFDEL